MRRASGSLAYTTGSRDLEAAFSKVSLASPRFLKSVPLLR
jgi:hypothetical protein